MRCLLAGASALALTIAPLALAEGDDGAPPTVLPPVTVPLPPEPRPESPSVRDPSGSSTVVDVSAHAGQVRDTAELAATAPGVVVQDSGGIGQSKSLLIRGANASGVAVLLDGIPLSGAGGMTDLSLVPVSALSRIEVLRGGAGARYGSGALGGVVNLVTPDLDQGARVEAELLGGSFSTYQAKLTAQFSLWGGADLVVLHGLKTDGDFVFRFDERPEDPSNPLTVAPRTNNDAQGGGLLLKDRRQIGAWTAATLLEGNVLSRGIAGTVWDPTQDERQDAARGSASVRLSRSFDSGLDLSVRGFARADRATFRGGMVCITNNDPNCISGRLTQTLLSDGASVDAGLVLGRHALSATAELGYDGLVETPTARWLRSAVMVMDEVILADGALTLAPSVRMDQQGRFVTVSPKLGASWTLPASFTVRGNVAWASRTPSFLELYVQQGTLAPNPDLRPEHALTADLSLEHRARWGSVSVGGFASRYQDLIVYELVPPFIARPVNEGNALVAGAEVEAKVQPWPWLSAQAAYTYLYSENLDSDPRFFGHPLPDRPAHRGTAMVELGPAILHAQLSVDAQSEVFTNRNETLRLPGRAFFNAALCAEFGDRAQWGLTAELKNAFDVQTQDLTGYPLPGRALFVSLRFTLDTSRPSRTPESDKATP